MDDEIESLVIRVRADTGAFARDVTAMKGSLSDGLGAGADRAGRAIEQSLLGAVRTGKFGFEDLKRTALSVLDGIASAGVRGGVGTLLGGGGLGGIVASLLGLPGRATGGPVTGGRAYMVGERGPEMFVPSASGRIEPMAAGGGVREVRVAIAVNAAAGEAPAALAKSSRQVARAVRAALTVE